ncbi:MAG: hypothetical protein FJX54_24245 [Alphaproteobacteria bacterium]|nr:hypothetical protein [Alphaproteobacteria bacterium]
MTREARAHPGLIALYGVAVLVLLLGHWQPLVLFSFSPEPWIMALSEAAAGKHRFGTDIVFTGGPLSDVYTRFFNPDTILRVLAAAYFMVAVQLSAIATLAARSRSLFFCLLLILALCFLSARDVQVMMTPLLVGLVALGRPEDRWPSILTAIGAIASAVSTLVKFSVFPLAIGVFLLVDFNRLRLRRIPFATIAYGTAFYLSFLLLAPSGSDFRLYLFGSLATSAGYSAAMSITGPWTEFVLYAALLAAATVALAAIERRRAEPFMNWQASGQILAVTLFLWLTFKIGFVRHDLHVLTAFSAVTLAVPLFALSRPPVAVARAAGAALLAVVCLGGLFMHLRLAYEPSMRYPLTTTLMDAVLAGPREIRRSVGVLADPQAWLAGHLADRQTYLASLAATSPVDDLDGTIDSVPSLQSGLIAAGLRYRPRPTIEEYTSYAPSLIARNRAFFASVDGPEFVVFEPVAIDGRYPAFAEGSSWPILLSHFAPKQMAGDGVLLHRRQEPLGDVLTPAVTGRARMEAPLPIEFGPEPAFLAIDIRPTLFGRLVDLLFQPPFLYLGVTPVGQAEQVYRLVPSIAREGFIASPMIKTAWQYVLLAEGNQADRIGPIQSIRVFSGPGGSLSYRRQFTYTARRIDRATMTANRDWSLTPDEVAAFERTRRFADLVAENGGSNPTFRVIAAGLYAHAPRRLPIDTQGSERLTVGFGMRRGSWGPGSTGDGVCFRALTADGSKALWERCLEPVRNAPDRVSQRETIPLPAGTARIILETDCRSHCGWDWSYWSEITTER